MENVLFKNKVAESGLVTIDLAELVVSDGELELFDLKPFLFMELIIKEKDFRQQLKDYDWNRFQGKVVAVTCTADAIIPSWAYMLVATYLVQVASDLYYGDLTFAKEEYLLSNIRKLNAGDFADKRVVVKGCGDITISDAAYLEITKKLRPVVQSIMYGEPCSTVPVFKRKVPAEL